MTVKELRMELEELEKQNKGNEDVLLGVGDGDTALLTYFWVNYDGNIVLDS